MKLLLRQLYFVQYVINIGSLLCRFQITREWEKLHYHKRLYQTFRFNYLNTHRLFMVKCAPIFLNNSAVNIYTKTHKCFARDAVFLDYVQLYMCTFSLLFHCTVVFLVSISCALNILTFLSSVQEFLLSDLC